MDKSSQEISEKIKLKNKTKINTCPANYESYFKDRTINNIQESKYVIFKNDII